MGLSNHYYWWIKADEVGGPDEMTSKIYHFPEADGRNLILSSGAAVMKSSEQQDASADFVQWLTAACTSHRQRLETPVQSRPQVFSAETPRTNRLRSKLHPRNTINWLAYSMDLNTGAAQPSGCTHFSGG